MTSRVFVVLAVPAACLALAITFVSSQPLVIPDRRAPLTIQAPERVDVGSPIMLKISGLDPSTDLELTIVGAYGPRRFTLKPDGDVLAFEVPPADRPESGRILVLGTQAGRLGAQTFELVPGPPADPIAGYLGPRTIVADAEDHAMIVAVPVDALGNPVASGTVVDYRLTRPTGEVEELQAVTRNLLSAQVIHSQTVAGTTRVAAAVGATAGPERELLEVAGTPEPFDLEVRGAIPLADGRSLMTVRTTTLADRHGNTVLDGVFVYLDLTGVTGRRRVSGVTIDGAAEFAVQAPTRPGRARAVGLSSGVMSEPLFIEFRAAVRTFPASIRQVDGGRLVTVGPVRTVAGAYVPDATTATIKAGDFEADVTLEAGTGSLVLPAGVPGSISISVLGARVIAR